MMAEEFSSGFLLIDTRGTLAEEVADRAPVERTCYLDTADTARPFGLSVLDGVLKDDRHRVAKDVCAFFDVIFPEGPTTLSRARSNYLLLNSLLLLMEGFAPNILSIPKLLSDSDYRTKCLRHCTDPVVRNFWEAEFPEWEDDDILPLRSKLGELFASSLIRNIIGQTRSTFSLSSGRITIANLDRSKLGDATAFLLGSLLLSRSQGATYISDLAFFASDHLAGMLAQDRFTLSLDYLDALPVKLRSAVLAIPDKTAFKCAPADADRIYFDLNIQNPTILTDLLPHEAQTKRGTIEPSAPANAARLGANRRHSRALFTRPREKVERKVSRFFTA